MDIDKTRQLIRQAISGLRVPPDLMEDAYQEGFVAFLEKKDIRAVIRKWLTEEKAFKNRLIDPDGSFLLEEQESHDKRLASGDVGTYTETIGDDIEVYNKI
jgi:hypothetical protein